MLASLYGLQPNSSCLLQAEEGQLCKRSESTRMSARRTAGTGHYKVQCNTAVARHVRNKLTMMG